MSTEETTTPDPWSANCPKCDHTVTAPDHMTIQVCTFCGSDVRKPLPKIKRKPQTLADQEEAERKKKAWGEIGEGFGGFLFGLGILISAIMAFLLLCELGLGLYEWASAWREGSEFKKSCYEAGDQMSAACKVALF